MQSSHSGSNSTSLHRAVRPHRFRIALTYCLTAVENVFALLYPFTIGLAINGLIAGDGLASLYPLGGIWLAHVVVGAVRQMYDTRLFTRVYGEVAGGMIERQRAAGVSTSEVAARSTMAREAVDFFEIELPMIFTASISLLGGIAMLFFYDVAAGAILAALLVFVAGLQLLYGRRVLKLSIRLNNRHEREVNAIEDGRKGRVRAHFRAIARWRVMLSDTQAMAWAAAEVLSLGATLLILLRIATMPGAQAGDIFAALAYVLNVLGALDQAPIIVQQLARLSDIQRRISHEET